MKSGHLKIAILVLVVFLMPQMAQATSIVTITFNQPVQSVVQGGSLTFTGTLSVSGAPDPVYIYGDSIATSPNFGLVGFDPPSPSLIMLDDFPFLLNFPFQISSDDLNGPSSFTFDLFTVSIGTLVTPGTYLGTFDILGGPFPGDSFGIASASFEIDVQPGPVQSVPEPNSLALLIAGCVAGIAFSKGRMRALWFRGMRP